MLKPNQPFISINWAVKQNIVGYQNNPSLSHASYIEKNNITM